MRLEYEQSWSNKLRARGEALAQIILHASGREAAEEEIWSRPWSSLKRADRKASGGGGSKQSGSE